MKLAISGGGPGWFALVLAARFEDTLNTLEAPS